MRSILDDRIKNIISLIQDDFVPFVEITMMPRMNLSRNSAIKTTSGIMIKKSTKTLKAICELCKKNYGEDALVLGRTIFESALDLAYVCKPETVEMRECLSNVFILHGLKEQADMRINISKIKNEGRCTEWINDLEKEKGKLSTHELVKEENLNDNPLTLYKHCIKRYKDYLSSIGKKSSDNRSWSLMSRKAMSELVGEPYECYYHFVYWSLSKYAHPSVLGSNSYYETSSRNDELGDVENALNISFDCYWRIVYMADKIYKLGLENEINLYCSSFVRCHELS